MAMYYQGGQEIQADGLQTLYLMNPNYATAYSDTQQTQQQLPSANMLMLNYAAAGNQLNVPTMQSGNGQHHLVGVPLGSGNPKFSHRQLLEHQHEVSGTRTGTPYFHQGLWGSVEQTSGGGGSVGIQPDIPTGVVGGGGAEVGFQRPAVVAPTQQQGLSLSLSSQQPGYGSLPMDHNSISMIISPTSGGGGGSSCSFSGVSNGPFSGGQSVVLGSKYIKAAQQLLDELVNVGKGIKAENNIMEKGKEKSKTDNKDSNMGLSGEEASIEMKGGDQLTTPQKQDIQMKKAKLMSVLDEVEQRYRQYHHQMQIVVASFEQATGIGSARSYTHLALQTISKQFRCLKDAISAQIKAASKSLGEDQEGLVGGKIEGSRLKFVDQQLRQQRALQHLGMMQNNAWRPQRGLPERAVSVLRAWLFEHFLHPYPKDSDKQMLAKQTGLTRSQVSNWFINARVRLWKPMVEEMYAEEMKNQEEDGRESNKEIGSKSITPKGKNAVQTDQLINTLNSQQEKSITQDEISNSSVTLSPSGNSPQARGGFGLVCALKVDGNVGKNTKQLRTDMQNSPSSILSMDMEMKFGDTRKGFINTNKFSSLVANNTSDGNGFGAFTIGELGQFNQEQLTTGFHGNGVSLTLGLPPSENHLPLSGSQPNFLSEQSMDLGNRMEMGMAEAHYDRVNKPQAASHSSIGYETIDFESRKRFAEPFLPDFVS